MTPAEELLRAAQYPRKFFGSLETNRFLWDIYPDAVEDVSQKEAIIGALFAAEIWPDWNQA